MFDRSPQGELAASIHQISRQAIEVLWQARGRHARKNVRRGQGRMKWKARPEGSASPSAGTRQGRSESECRRGSRARCSHDRIRRPQRRLRAESKEEGTRHKGPKTTVGLPWRERTTVARTRSFLPPTVRAEPVENGPPQIKLKSRTCQRTPDALRLGISEMRQPTALRAGEVHMMRTVGMGGQTIPTRRLARRHGSVNETGRLHRGEIAVDGTQADRLANQIRELARREITMRILLEEFAQLVALFCAVRLHLRMIRKSYHTLQRCVKHEPVPHPYLEQGVPMDQRTMIIRLVNSTTNTVCS